MIITRSPLRITLGGGGTDLPSYYREHGGFLIAAAIDKYVYVTVHPAVRRRASFSSTRRSSTSSAVDEIEHPIIREAFRDDGHHRAPARDHDAGRHPGRHRARLVGQLHHRAAEGAVHVERRLLLPGELAELACEIEIDRLGEPIGKQDQYIAAYGGITCFKFHAERRGPRRAARDAADHAARSRGQPAAVLHRLLAQRGRHPQGSGHAHEAGRQRR